MDHTRCCTWLYGGRGTERNCHKTLGGHDMGGIRMTDCYETFIPPQPTRPRPSTAATTTATATAATDFLTATGFRFRPPGERASDAALVALPKQFLFRSLSFAQTDRQTDRVILFILFISTQFAWSKLSLRYVCTYVRTEASFLAQRCCRSCWSPLNLGLPCRSVGIGIRQRPPPALRCSFSPFWHALPPFPHPALINASQHYFSSYDWPEFRISGIPS